MSINYKKFTLVTRGSDGEDADDSSKNPYFSPDGHGLLFESRATNLTAGNANQSQSDVFFTDLVTGEIVQVSTNANGIGGNGLSVISLDTILASPFSPDGDKVLFWSTSSNLVSGDRNFAVDLFMKDLDTGEVTLVTATADGRQGSGASLYGGSFSPDGDSVLFDSGTAFVAEDRNNGSDVFIKDLATGAITRISTLADGSEANGESQGAVFSPDGTKVLFTSDADNYVAGDINGRADVFLKDLRTGEVTLVSRTAGGGAANHLSEGLCFSPDGSQILYTSLASNIVAGDSNGVYDLFAYDIASGRVRRVSTGSNGGQLSESHESGQFTPDGSGIVFTSSTSPFSTDIYFKDLRTGEVSLVTRGVDGEPATGFLDGYALSPDGIGIAIASDADNLVDDPPGQTQVYIGPVQAPLPEIRGTNGDNRLAGTAVAESFLGFSGDDILIGRGGSDRLNGGRGADSMSGGSGHDLYVVNNVGDRAVESRRNGLDTVESYVSFTLGANVERLVLIGSKSVNGRGNSLANELVGNAAANALIGGGGGDILDGQGGGDRMVGGGGNDQYFVERRGDRVVEAQSAGRDTVASTVSHTLAANVEHLDLAGAGRLNGTGNGLANVITGNDAANILNGRGGVDWLIGEAGNDIYIFNSGRDRAIEEIGGGFDRVKSTTNCVLGSNIEDLALMGSARNGTGNVLDNRITGNWSKNFLFGGEGDDILSGGRGADRLYGGIGDDRMSGGIGADIFYFDERPGALGGVDRITDFDHGIDRVGLDRSIFDEIADDGRLARGAFAEGTAHDGGDRIIYQQATGRIFYDSDGNGDALAVLIAEVTGGTDLSSADFFAYGGG